MTGVCANCGETLAGESCAACGQKRLVDKDRRLAHLLAQGFDAATDLDGRFWRSLRALVLTPGRLSRDYLDGRRKHWMAPMALFLLANVVYFVAPPTITDFNLPLADQMGQPHAVLTQSWVDDRVAARDRQQRQRWQALPAANRPDTPSGYSLSDYARDYSAQSGNVGKALIILHVPFLAAGLALCFWRRRMYFAEHLVVACHLFTFLLLMVPALLVPLEWLAVQWGGDNRAFFQVVKFGSLLLIGLYFSLSLRRVYAAAPWVWLVAPVPLIVAMLVGNVFVYRTLQFMVTYAVT